MHQKVYKELLYGYFTTKRSNGQQSTSHLTLYKNIILFRTDNDQFSIAKTSGDLLIAIQN
jgi:hypothetical protein